MKVIDLLNKIANGEEVPEIIEFDDTKYYFRKIYKEYYRFDNSSTLYRDYNVFKILNDEVEIIEEDKEIEELEFCKIDDDTISGLIKSINELNNEYVHKMNELIKAVNKIKKGK